tara:strand:+ start:1262 stop:1681 length:420 start_codon:yes stop_codon:yes gene_type:complete
MNVAELLTNLTTHYNAIIRSLAQRQSLTCSQAFLLLNIPFDGITMSTLAYKLGIDNSTLTRNINKLNLSSLVSKKRDKYDKRIINVVITSEGKDVLSELERPLNKFNLSILNHINIEDQNKTTELLEKLVWAMDCLRNE